MSMNLYLKSISDETISVLKEHPAYIKSLVVMAYNKTHIDFHKYILETTPPAHLPRVEDMSKKVIRDLQDENDRLRLSLRNAVVGDHPAMAKDLERAVLGIHKEWHGIHYVLTKSPWDASTVLGQALLGGSEIGEDLGYGPARIMESEAVKEIADAIGAFTKEMFDQNYDKAEMEKLQIYPGGWMELEDNREILWDAFRKVQEYYREASEQHLGMLVFMM